MKETFKVPKSSSENHVPYRDITRRKHQINEDIQKIDDVFSRCDESEMKELHIILDGKYSAYIPDWGMSMYGYNRDYGFVYRLLDTESKKHNLLLMKSKLEGYAGMLELNSKMNGSKSDWSVTVNNNNNNNNQINIEVSFEETRQKIEDMTALSREQTDEILEKIDELENINKENISRKNKWEKVKPIIAFALDKGADAAIAILALVMQMKLGA